jgi:hypothetical protein
VRERLLLYLLLLLRLLLYLLLLRLGSENSLRNAVHPLTASSRRLLLRMKCV